MVRKTDIRCLDDLDGQRSGGFPVDADSDWLGRLRNDPSVSRRVTKQLGGDDVVSDGVLD